MNELPRLALGTWLMGGTKDPDPDNDDAKDIAAIQLAISEGVTLIDTAQNYANGRCEELVGQAVRGLPRDSYQILTKQYRQKLRYQEVIDGCDESLQRLGVDFIDYFVCHGPTDEGTTGDFFKAANQLLADGKIKNIGVSNFGPRLLKVAIEECNTPLALNQVHVSVDDGDVFSTKTQEFCADNGIPIQAYRTLVSLSSNIEALTILERIASEREISIQQVALAYLSTDKLMKFTIKASSKKHWDEIKVALDFKLTADEVKEIYESHSDIEGAFRHFLVA